MRVTAAPSDAAARPAAPGPIHQDYGLRFRIWGFQGLGSGGLRFRIWGSQGLGSGGLRFRIWGF